MENKVFEHVMLDLETMGNKSNAAIISIGAVQFNLETGETGEEFYRRVDLQSSLDCGLKINASTLYWWLQQNDAAREEVARGGDHLAHVLADLAMWFKDNCVVGFKLWGNGARFDIGILEDAYVACAWTEMPWGFRDERDLRTLVAFQPAIKTFVQNEWKEKMVEHHPIDDCKLQIEYAYRIWNLFPKMELNPEYLDRNKIG